MPYKKLQRQAEAKQISVEQLVADALKNNRDKVYWAAVELGVYPRAIINFLNKHPELKPQKNTSQE